MSDPVAFITGASRGIGKQLAVDLAAAGYDVVCTARSTSASPGALPGTIEETATGVEKHGQRSLVIGLDVRNEEAIASAARRVAEEFGRCDLLVNNAAIAPTKPAFEDDTRRWNSTVAATDGPFWLMYYLREQLEASPGGRPDRQHLVRRLRDPRLRAHQLHDYEARPRSDDGGRRLRPAGQGRRQLHSPRGAGLDRGLGE